MLRYNFIRKRKNLTHIPTSEKQIFDQSNNPGPDPNNMNKSCIAFFGMLILFTSCQENASAPGFEVVTNEKTRQFDTLYTELFDAGKFHGNVLVAEGGQIVYQNSFGLANEEDSISLSLESVFELASVSKQFTAMGIVQLQQEGKLAFEDDFAAYIPELAVYEGITIKHLLTHTSGLPDYMELAEDHWDKTKIATNEDIIKLFQVHHPEIAFEPNESWEYSNTGYLLLGTIIERVSGKTFEGYLKETIFDPLGMENTFVYRRRYAPQVVGNYAQGYIYSESLQRKILPDEMGQNFYVVYLDGIVGDGMVNSNLYDLLKWDRALYENTLVNAQEKEMIFSSYQTSDSTETDYGFGWMIEESDKYQSIVHHSGGWAGYRTYIERHLDTDKTIIILQNYSARDIETPIKNTRRLLYGLPIEQPIQLDAEILALYVGAYLTESGKEREIVLEDDKLWVPMNPEFKLELIPVSSTKFFVDGFSPEVTYTFLMNEQNVVTGYRVQQDGTGVDQLARRKE